MDIYKYFEHSPNENDKRNLSSKKVRLIGLCLFFVSVFVSADVGRTFISLSREYIFSSQVVNSTISTYFTNSNSSRENLDDALMVLEKQNYSFFDVAGSFDGVDILRISEVNPSDFHNMILASIPSYLRKRASKYISLTMQYAKKYQVDPFWALSIMWTESHFNSKARSYVDAVGLMQIMPATGEFLNRLMRRKKLISKNEGLSSKKDSGIYNSERNIEMGIFYLRKLLTRFNSYKYATVAYNMGPNWVKKRLARGRPVGTKNLYLTKVSKAYKNITAEYRVYLKNNHPHYLGTYVAQNRVEKKSFSSSNDEIIPRFGL